MVIEISATLKEAASLFVKNGLWLTVEFLAAMIAITTAYVLLMPSQAFFLFSGGEVTNVMFLFVNPYSILSSLIYATVSTSVILRLWPRISGEEAPRPTQATWLAIFGLSLLVDHVLTASLFFLIIPALILSALTTIMLPLLTIEGRGWLSLGSSIQETGPHLVPLTGLWGVILIPWVILVFTTGPVRNPETEITITALWLREIAHDLYAPPFVAFSICLIMAVYQKLRTPEDQSETFR